MGVGRGESGMDESSRGCWEFRKATDHVGVVADLGLLAGFCAQVEVDVESLPRLELHAGHREVQVVIGVPLGVVG